jgi:large subunit ribosomal protein L9
VEVILLENIKKLGALGKKIAVKPGYGRNYLIPKKKAILATSANVKQFEERKEELMLAEQKRMKQLEERAANLHNTQVIISSLVSDEGKLYGSVGNIEILEAMQALGKEIHKHEIQLPLGPIKEIGEYEVAIALNHGEVTTSVKVIVNAKK